MKNNKGYYTLESSIIVPFILTIVVLILSLIFTLFYKGYYETQFNRDVINKGYTLQQRDIKQLEIDVISLNSKSTIYQKRVDDHFLKGLLLQETMQFGKEWLDE